MDKTVTLVKHGGTIVRTVFRKDSSAAFYTVLQQLRQRLKQKLPEFQGPVTPEVSVEMMMKIIDSVTVEGTGFDYSHLGKRGYV